MSMGFNLQRCWHQIDLVTQGRQFDSKNVLRDIESELYLYK